MAWQPIVTRWFSSILRAMREVDEFDQDAASSVAPIHRREFANRLRANGRCSCSELTERRISVIEFNTGYICLRLSPVVVESGAETVR